MLHGAFVPQSLEYPTWVAEKYPKIAEQPEWVETTRYVGVIGGAGFDYLAGRVAGGADRASDFHGRPGRWASIRSFSSGWRLSDYGLGGHYDWEAWPVLGLGHARWRASPWAA